MPSGMHWRPLHYDTAHRGTALARWQLSAGIKFTQQSSGSVPHWGRGITDPWESAHPTRGNLNTRLTHPWESNAGHDCLREIVTAPGPDRVNDELPGPVRDTETAPTPERTNVASPGCVSTSAADSTPRYTSANCCLSPWSIVPSGAGSENRRNHGRRRVAMADRRLAAVSILMSPPHW